MMAIRSYNLEKCLECGICHRKFEEPKVLDCQHTFCKHCLKGLVTRHLFGKRYKIKCPECNKKSKVLYGDVANLPSNHHMNYLLDLRSKENSKPFCDSHEGETLKIFCLTCHDLICRDCALINHHHHERKFAKEVFLAEKEKILNAMRESKEKILALEASMDDVEEQIKNLDQNAKDIKKKIDKSFAKAIQFLKKKKKFAHDQLQKSVLTQKDKLHSDMRCFSDSLDHAKCSLGLAEHIIAHVSDEDALMAKDAILRHLNDIISHSMPTPQMSYDFGADDMLDVISKMAASFSH